MNLKGSLVFISSNSWLDVDYGKYLQEGILEKCRLKYIIGNRAKRSFEESKINTVISVMGKKTGGDLSGKTDFLSFKDLFEEVIGPKTMSKELLGKFGDSREVKIEGEAIEVASSDSLRSVIVPRKSLWKLGGGQVKKLHTKLNQNKDREGILIPSGSYSGMKWSKFLRAPDIYFKILNKCEDKLVPLGKIAEITRGFTTGANDFFFVRDVTSIIDNDDLSQVRNLKRDKTVEEIKSEGFSVILPGSFNNIEENPLFLVEKTSLTPGIRKTSDYNSLNAENTQTYLFSPTAGEKLPPSASEYVKWGENKNFHSSRTCQNRSNWWSVIGGGNKKPEQIGFNYNIHDTGHFLYSNAPLAFSDNFHMVCSDDEIIQILGESTIIDFFINVNCRTTFGEGKAKLQTYELADIHFPNPNDIPKKRKSKLSSLSEEVKSKPKGIMQEVARTSEEVILEKVEEKRRELDKIIMGDILGLSKDEQLEVYRGVIRLVKNRIEKAQSV